jgi:hypothetical protein
VVLLGRLCLYGAGAARLHEELISISARWVDPSQRKGPLKLYGREAELKTLDLLEEALLPKSSREVAAAVRKTLQTSGPQDVQQLLPHLEERGAQLAATAQAKLSERGEKEAQAMRGILEDQKKRVAATIEHYAKDDQGVLFPDIEEQRQLESNKRHWHKRLAAIDHELATEPDRIRDVYRVKAQRIEPIGLVYLWPVTN